MKKSLFTSLSLILGIAYLPLQGVAQIKGPSSSQTPYLFPTVQGGVFTSILTTGDAVGGYKMAGIPDGLGAFDNGDGTFTLLMNHEIGNTLGAIRAHGSRGAFVSKWVINKSGLSVVSGEDLIKKVNLWNAGSSSFVEYSASNPSSLTAFTRFCSADLPAVSAFYNAATGLGTQERIFLNGEESGNEGRGFAHIVTGASAGISYEIPRAGKFSWENAVTNPATGDKTVVAGLDDATPGQVYFYIGTKTSSGTDIDKAGLTNGKLYAPVVAGFPSEPSATTIPAGTSFTMADLGNVENITGADLQSASVAAGVTQFLRPEDGAWDPSHPEDFYFATTNAFTSPSRLWKLHFTNINDLTQGGTITAVLDGTEGQKMLDNLAIDSNGHILLVEDVGNNVHIGKTWQYDIATDVFTQVSGHDSSRFIIGAPNYLTQDEEASGIIDVQNILGSGMFLVDVQAHYSQPAELVEGGQLLAFYNPLAAASAPSVSISYPSPGSIIKAGSTVTLEATATDADGSIAKVEFYNGPVKFAEDTVAPYQYTENGVESGNYAITAKATDNSGRSTVSDTLRISVDACTGSGSITAEGYTDIPGSTVASLTSNPAYPFSPSVTASLNSLKYGNELGSNYGARVRGYICAPQTGNYIFYIAGNDQAGLWLSTDDNPSNKVLIAYTESAVSPGVYTTYPSQKSAPVRLVKGAKYYVETLHKESSGVDFMSVAWTLPDGSFESPVAGSRLSPVDTDSLSSNRIAFQQAMVEVAEVTANAKGLVVKVTPNPTRTYFTLSTQSNRNVALEIVLSDISGRLVERRTQVAANGTIQIGKNLLPGIYFIKVLQGNNIQKVKVLKQ